MTKLTKEDFGLWIISLVIAVVLWVNSTVGRQETIAEKQLVGINLRAVGSSDRFILDYKPGKVDVVLKGSPDDLSKISPEDVRVTIYLSRLTDAGKWFVVPQIRFQESQGVTNVKIIPDKIEVTLTEKVPYTSP